MGTFNTIESGMSPNILFLGGLLPYQFQINTGNIVELTSAKLSMSPHFPI